VLEAVALVLWRGRLIQVVTMLLPGICLLFALRAALSATAWPTVPLALTAALAAHVLDVLQKPK